MKKKWKAIIILIGLALIPNVLYWLMTIIHNDSTWDFLNRIASLSTLGAPIYFTSWIIFQDVMKVPFFLKPMNISINKILVFAIVMILFFVSSYMLKGTLKSYIPGLTYILAGAGWFVGAFLSADIRNFRGKSGFAITVETLIFTLIPVFSGMMLGILWQKLILLFIDTVRSTVPLAR